VQRSNVEKRPKAGVPTQTISHQPVGFGEKLSKRPRAEPFNRMKFLHAIQKQDTKFANLLREKKI